MAGLPAAMHSSNVVMTTPEGVDVAVGEAVQLAATVRPVKMTKNARISTRYMCFEVMVGIVVDGQAKEI